MKGILFFIFMTISAFASYSLDPDRNKAHCLAFDGIWGEHYCTHRMEFQQYPIKTSLISIDTKQWCNARGGKLIKGRKCSSKSKQGLIRYPSDSKSMTAAKIIEKIRSCAEWKYNCRFGSSYPKYTRNRLKDIGFEFYYGVGKLLNLEAGNYLEDLVLSESRHHASEQGYSHCQKVCFSACVALQTLKYDEVLENTLIEYGQRDVMSLFEPIEKKLEQSSGVCTDHSRLADLILDDLGVHSQKVAIDYPDISEGSSATSGYGHVMLKIKLNKRFQLFDSSGGGYSCSFYNL